jgi:hypothetical protein
MVYTLNGYSERGNTQLTFIAANLNREMQNKLHVKALLKSISSCIRFDCSVLNKQQVHTAQISTFGFGKIYFSRMQSGKLSRSMIWHFYLTKQDGKLSHHDVLAGEG